MERESWRDAAADRVYRTIKARVITYAFPQGRRMYLQPLADALGVSTTPVREAMNRLAAEDLVIKAPRKGFIAPSLSRKNLRGYYELTKLLLENELMGLDDETRRKLPEFETIAVLLYKLNRRILTDPNTLASYTGEVFAGIASLRNNMHVVQSVRRANDHLHFIRTVECQHLEHVQKELIKICELVLSGRCDELLLAIRTYHQKRVRELENLLEIEGR